MNKDRFTISRFACRFIPASAVPLLGLCLALTGPDARAAAAPGTDPNYSETVLGSGHQWKLLEIHTVSEDGTQPLSDRVYSINGSAGLADAPLPDSIKQGLIDDLAARPEGEEAAFVISKKVVDEVIASDLQGAATPGLLALAEDDGFGAMAKGSCGDRNIDKSKSFAVSTPFNREFEMDDGFKGSISLTGGASVDAEGRLRIVLKRKKIWFVCLPYGVRFDSARVWGTVQGDPGVTLSGELTYSNPNPVEWPIAKPHLFSFGFMAGPIPVHVGFNLPITAGFDKNGINASVAGAVAYTGQRSISGYFDYSCTSKECVGNSDIDTADLGSQLLAGEVSARFRPSIYTQVAVRGYLYSENLDYAQLGVRAYLHGDFWGYYGDNCGDADGDGQTETVDAATFDLDWQLHITAQADTFFTNEWRKTLKAYDRRHLRFWDLRGGAGSRALTPVLAGPASVPSNAPQTYTARMRSCWPYSDNVNYTLAWGDGGTSSFSGASATATPVSHTWAQAGTPRLSLTAVRDAHGRNLNQATSRDISVVPGLAKKAMTWRLLGTRGSYMHVGSDAQTNAYLGDTETTASLPILCLWKNNLPRPSGITFDTNNGWSGGSVRLTAPVRGSSLTSRSAADAICSSAMGAGYRMAEFHDGGGGWSWWGQGVLSGASRFWVAINDQPANPWD